MQFITGHKTKLNTFKESKTYIVFSPITMESNHKDNKKTSKHLATKQDTYNNHKSKMKLKGNIFKIEIKLNYSILKFVGPC